MTKTLPDITIQEPAYGPRWFKHEVVLEVGFRDRSSTPRATRRLRAFAFPAHRAHPRRQGGSPKRSSEHPREGVGSRELYERYFISGATRCVRGPSLRRDCQVTPPRQPAPEGATNLN